MHNTLVQLASEKKCEMIICTTQIGIYFYQIDRHWINSKYALPLSVKKNKSMKQYFFSVFPYSSRL